MQRKPIPVIFLKGLLYGIFGNLLSGIMTIALAPFISEWFIPYIAVLFTVFIYPDLQAAPATKTAADRSLPPGSPPQAVL